MAEAVERGTCAAGRMTVATRLADPTKQLVHPFVQREVARSLLSASAASNSSSSSSGGGGGGGGDGSTEEVRLLDLGCGDGLQTLQLLRALQSPRLGGLAVHALVGGDCHLESLDKARELYAANAAHLAKKEGEEVAKEAEEEEDSAPVTALRCASFFPADFAGLAADPAQVAGNAAIDARGPYHAAVSVLALHYIGRRTELDATFARCFARLHSGASLCAVITSPFDTTGSSRAAQSPDRQGEDGLGNSVHAAFRFHKTVVDAAGDVAADSDRAPREARYVVWPEGAATPLTWHQPLFTPADWEAAAAKAGFEPLVWHALEPFPHVEAAFPKAFFDCARDRPYLLGFTARKP